MKRWLALALVALALCGVGPGAPAAATGRSFHDASATGMRLPVTGASGVRAQSVLGVDERVPVLDTSVFPFSSIVYLELRDGDDEVFGSCTGTFIGPDALLTAGHCLWDAEAGNWGAEHIRVVPGKDADFEPFGSQFASDWWVPDGYADSGASDWDWGVIKLPNDLLSYDTGWLSVAVATTEILEGEGFSPAIVGYPADKPDGTMWGHIRPSFTSIEDFRLRYDIDTAPGQSGSAIWSAAEGPYLGIIVGIHTQGGLLNSGSRIDSELLDDLLVACEVMECSIDVQTIDAPQPEPEPEPEPLPNPPANLPFRSYGIAIARD